MNFKNIYFHLLKWNNSERGKSVHFMIVHYDKSYLISVYDVLLCCTKDVYRTDSQYIKLTKLVLVDCSHRLCYFASNISILY